MKNQQIYGLAGIGNLGEAMVKNWNKKDIKIGIYHPDKLKQMVFLEKYKNCYSLTKNTIKDIDHFLLALPASVIKSVIGELVELGFQGTFINLATSVPSEQLLNIYPSLSIFSMKFMGHSRSLSVSGNGLFITEHTTPEKITTLFSQIGNVIFDDPSIVENVNRKATYYAIESAIRIEEKLKAGNIPKQYQREAIESIVPEVIRSYINEELGHFGKQIQKDVTKGQQDLS